MEHKRRQGRGNGSAPNGKRRRIQAEERAAQFGQLPDDTQMLMLLNLPPEDVIDMLSVSRKTFTTVIKLLDIYSTDQKTIPAKLLTKDSVYCPTLLPKGEGCVNRQQVTYRFSVPYTDLDFRRSTKHAITCRDFCARYYDRLDDIPALAIFENLSDDTVFYFPSVNETATTATLDLDQIDITFRSAVLESPILLSYDLDADTFDLQVVDRSNRNAPNVRQVFNLKYRFDRNLSSPYFDYYLYPSTTSGALKTVMFMSYMVERFPDLTATLTIPVYAEAIWELGSSMVETEVQLQLTPERRIPFFTGTGTFNILPSDPVTAIWTTELTHSQLRALFIKQSGGSVLFSDTKRATVRRL